MPKRVEIHLPYFKQGYDLKDHISHCDGDIVKGLRRHAESLRASAAILDRIAEIVTRDLPKAVADRLSGNFPIEINADTHNIMVFGEPEILQKLLEEGLAEPWEDEEDWGEEEFK